MSSNIRRYGRVQLLIEVLLRLFRIFDNYDKDVFSSHIKPYSKLGSEKYIYELKSSDLTHESEKLGKLYCAVYEYIKLKYSETDEFRIFERVYKEHFTTAEGNTQAKPNDELNSNMLQSPDDEDATYRKKRGQESKGFTINATETANPDNEKEYTVECPEQTVISSPTKKRNKNILKIPKERRKIRPNVEATIKEFKGKTKAGKLKVRGIFKASLFAFAMGISINFGRIYRLLSKNEHKLNRILTFFNVYLSQILFFIILTPNTTGKNKVVRNF